MRQSIAALLVVALGYIALDGSAAEPIAPVAEPAWASAADRQPPMTVEQARAFIRRLHEYVRDHHLKTAADSPQRGMLYEYFNVPHAGKADQWIEGEGLDTMHDGSWYATAMVNAFRATGDDTYRKFLSDYQVPFYCKMLNHSDTLFSAKQNDADPKAHVFNREHMLQEGEKGFVPYWWDDGASVSLDRVRSKNPLSPTMCRDLTVGKPNPDFHLAGYSLGSSNHMAQDLGIMVEQSWLLFRQSKDDESKKLTAELADAAANLHACRTRHFGDIPMTLAPAALVAGDAKMMKRVPDPAAETNWKPQNHYYRALYEFKPGEKMPFPGFADDDEYRYYYGIIRAGGKLPEAMAFRIIYDAYTEPLLYRTYCDDAPVPPGINRFDLYPYDAIDGKPTRYRSDRNGTAKKPLPIGSRMGPQNMVACGWALQLLTAHHGIWNDAISRRFKDDAHVEIDDMPAPLPGEHPVPDFDDAKPLAFPHLSMFMRSTRSALVLSGSCDTAEAQIEIFAQPDAKGASALVVLKKDDLVTITNNRKEPLKWDRTSIFGNSATRPAGQGFGFSIAIPYTFVKGQKPWINGVEMGRYSIRVGDSKARNFMMAASEAQVVSSLRRQLAGGLRTWQAIFDQYGYIPTGIDAGTEWDHFSDTGGYAHLISAASEWILCLEQKFDWELQQAPAVLDAK